VLSTGEIVSQTEHPRLVNSEQVSRANGASPGLRASWEKGRDCFGVKQIV
jgi:hypothetical protein